MSKSVLAIDNGVTGTIAMLWENGKQHFQKSPVFSVQDYTKTKSNITRIDVNKMKELLLVFISKSIPDNMIAVLERPFKNPKFFSSTVSAMRCFEATIICLEFYNIPYMFMDSKEWQKELLPKGTMGSDVLKKASLDIGNRLFPQFQDVKHPDRDSLLMAEYVRRKGY